VRFLVHRHRWFFFTSAALLHVVLHGVFGLSYLAAGSIAAILAAGAVAADFRRSRKLRANAGGASP